MSLDTKGSSAIMSKAKKQARRQLKQTLEFIDAMYEIVRKDDFYFDKSDFLSDLGLIEGHLDVVRTLLKS